MSLEGVRELVSTLERLDVQLARSQATQISAEGHRVPARSVVDRYFRTVRPTLEHGIAAEMVHAADTALQDLLQGTQQRPVKERYRGLVKKAIARLRDLERVLLVGSSRVAGASLEPVDQQIVSTLKSLVPSAALSYQQAIIDLAAESRLSWRGPATDLREALREILDHLAPDKEVEAQPGYRPEPDTKGPTMKQKVRYLFLKRGLSRSAAETSERAAKAVEEAVGSFVRSVYARSSTSTHTPTDKREVLRVRELVRVSLRELLELQ